MCEIHIVILVLRHNYFIHSYHVNTKCINEAEISKVHNNDSHV